jgi:hypothetical protein
MFALRFYRRMALEALWRAWFLVAGALEAAAFGLQFRHAWKADQGEQLSTEPWQPSAIGFRWLVAMLAATYAVSFLQGVWAEVRRGSPELAGGSLYMIEVPQVRFRDHKLYMQEVVISNKSGNALSLRLRMLLADGTYAKVVRHADLATPEVFNVAAHSNAHETLVAPMEGEQAEGACLIVEQRGDGERRASVPLPTTRPHPIAFNLG